MRKINSENIIMGVAQEISNDILHLEIAHKLGWTNLSFYFRENDNHPCALRGNPPKKEIIEDVPKWTDDAESFCKLEKDLSKEEYQKYIFWLSKKSSSKIVINQRQKCEALLLAKGYQQ